MKRFTSVDTTVLKQHYEKKVHELEQEKKKLQVGACAYALYLCFIYLGTISNDLIFVVKWQKEIDELRHNLSNISSNSGDGAQKLKEEYLQKLNVLETQVNVGAATHHTSLGHMARSIIVFSFFL